MRKLLVVHAFILFAAGVVLIISPNAIFHPVGVDVPPGTNVVAYLLAAGEIAFAFLSFSARRLTDASALRTIAAAIVVFHTLSGAFEAITAMRGLASGLIWPNIVARAIVAGLFVYLRPRAA